MSSVLRERGCSAGMPLVIKDLVVLPHHQILDHEGRRSKSASDWHILRTHSPPNHHWAPTGPVGNWAPTGPVGERVRDGAG